MSLNIVGDALKFYDENNEKYESLKKKIKYFKYAMLDQKDIDGVKIVFLDEDKKELFTSRVEIIGKYYNTINTWIWGWSIPNIDKSLTTIIRKVFLYGTDIDARNSANVMLKNELLTSRFIVSDTIQLDIHCAIASYLAKKPVIFIWKEFIISPDEIVEVKGEFSKEDTGVMWYTFIVDAPDINTLSL
jgi:hypothetical protein